MNIQLYIAMHKKYQVPKDDIYIPLQVGPADSFTELRDNTGDNIAKKNPNFCELTALYWAWCNSTADYIGLVHYRRHFSKKSRLYKKLHGSFDSVLQGSEAEALLKKADMVVPGKRRYYIETLYSHYNNTLIQEKSHLDIARELIAKTKPEYLPYVDEAYCQTWGYMFNMGIWPKAELDSYCSFLFPVLFAMEEQVDTTGLDAFSARLFGRVSEVLFNAWVKKRQAEGMTIAECSVIDMEPVNWPAKIAGFLSAKFFGKKYTKSM